MNHPIWFKPSVALIILLTGSIPVFIYLWAFSQAPMIDADSALNILNKPEHGAILVDVRSVDEFSEMHIAGSYNWPANEIASLRSLEYMNSNFKGKMLLLICNSGVQSAQAARKLQSLGASQAYYVRGGLQKWIGEGAVQPQLGYTQFYICTKASIVL